MAAGAAAIHPTRQLVALEASAAKSDGGNVVIYSLKGNSAVRSLALAELGVNVGKIRQLLFIDSESMAWAQLLDGVSFSSFHQRVC